MPTHLLKIARHSIQSHLGGESVSLQIEAVEKSEHEIEAAKGLFVTLWSLDRFGQESLRGCIGRHSRLHPTIADEVADCAIEAAMSDPRFPPLTLRELSIVRLEISLLGGLEPVASPTDLDPEVYGVVVKSGFRQATLLPGIEGVDTVERQLGIVKQKAGIPPHVTPEIWRFPVRKIRE